MKHVNVAQHIHSDRLERYLGAEKVAQLSSQFRTWYGPPVHILDLPGSVRICKGGDFIGSFRHGYAESIFDITRSYLKRLYRETGRFNPAMAGSGFASISDALARASGGFGQMMHGGMLAKTSSTLVAGGASSLWRVGTMPAAGSAGAAAPGGTAQASTDTGAMVFNNPASGNLRLVGADFQASVINTSVMLYDRLFSVAKTMASTATQAVTGVPTRYQSTTPTDEDYCGGNFCFPEVGGTALAATAHNWTVCQYTNQAGTASQSFPSVTGNSGAIVDRLDLPLNEWFMPLNGSDVGVQKLSQMQCSASVATGIINFVIGHPLGMMAFPIINCMLPFNWLTSRNQAPRIFNSACLSMLVMPAPATTATTFSGILYATAAA